MVASQEVKTIKKKEVICECCKKPVGTGNCFMCTGYRLVMEEGVRESTA